MLVNKNSAKELIKKIVIGEMGGKYDIEIRRRTILVNAICIVAIINLIPFGILSLIKGKPLLAAINISVTIISSAIVIYLRKIGYHIFLSYLGLSFVAILFFYLFATGGINNTGYIWYYIFPLGALFLLGSKKGTIATFLLFFLAIIVFTIDGYTSIITVYPVAFKIRFISSFLVVFALSYFFEIARERTQKQLIEKNIDLEKTITELRHAEDALRESETSLKATLESTADGILVVNKTGQVIAKNTRFSEMWRIPDEIVKTNDDEKLLNCVLDQLVKPKEFLSKVQELYKSSLKDFDVLYFKDGRVFERYSEPLIIENNITGRVWSFRDITENRKAEQEKAELREKLQRAQKMEAIGTLAGGVAHDLNNILSGIVSYPDLLLMEIPEESPLKKPILTIQQSGNKAAAIVQDLLTLARRGIAIKEVVSLNDIIVDYLKSPEYDKLKSYYPQVEIKTDLAKDLLNIFGSSVHLNKTIMNLVSNGAEAIIEKGEIILSTENCYIDHPITGYDDVKEGDYVTFTISDNGRGIPPNIIERIFEPFFTKKTMGRSGTGLGMAVVWGSVKDHDGYIDVKSTEGRGTIFTLYFPATRKKCERDIAKLSIEDYHGRGEKILVVDDVKEQREIASYILSKLGYSVTTIPSGEQAIEYVKNNSVDLLILDMIMDPGIDGLETFKNIIKFYPGQKAIIASGFSETERVREAQKLGAGKYVKKPYTFESIGIAVKEELERR